MKVVVLGRGKLGRALAAHLKRSGAPISWQGSRSVLRTARTREPVLYLLAVSDGAIETLAERLAPRLAAKDIVLHCAGARELAELSACAARGAATGVLHPLVSFASKRAVPAFLGTTFVAHGSPRALRASRWLCKQLGARCLVAERMGPAYHAAAALLANGSAALAFVSAHILVELGFAQRDAERALAGLLGTVAVNVRALGVPAALTGPVARGDYASVARHQRALAALSSQLAGHYRRMQPVIEACAAAMRAAETKAAMRAAETKPARRPESPSSQVASRAQRHK